MRVSQGRYIYYTGVSTLLSDSDPTDPNLIWREWRAQSPSPVPKLFDAPRRQVSMEGGCDGAKIAFYELGSSLIFQNFTHQCKDPGIQEIMIVM